MKENLLISRCFLGVNCKYNGKNNFLEKIEQIKQKYNLIDVCPESDGGLPTPRTPSEIFPSKRVISKDGTDVTAEYNKGANIALEACLRNNCKKALLKESSPSCGVKYVYDGTFSGTKVSGMGVTTKLLKLNNIEVFSEDEIDLLL